MAPERLRFKLTRRHRNSLSDPWTVSFLRLKTALSSGWIWLNWHWKVGETKVQNYSKIQKLIFSANLSYQMIGVGNKREKRILCRPFWASELKAGYKYNKEIKKYTIYSCWILDAKIDSKNWVQFICGWAFKSILF